MCRPAGTGPGVAGAPSPSRVPADSGEIAAVFAVARGGTDGSTGEAGSSTDCLIPLTSTAGAGASSSSSGRAYLCVESPWTDACAGLKRADGVAGYRLRRRGRLERPDACRSRPEAAPARADALALLCREYGPPRVPAFERARVNDPLGLWPVGEEAPQPLPRPRGGEGAG